MSLSEINLLSVFLGGIFLWSFIWRSSQDIAVFILEDFWSRSLYYLFASPVTITEIMISTMLIGMIRSIISFLTMATLGMLIFSFNIFSIDILALVLFISIIMLFGWFIGIFVTAMMFRFGLRIQVLAWSLAFLIMPFSCVFYALSALPNWAQNIAVLLPTTHVFESLRSVLNNGPILWGGIAYSISITVLLLIISSVFLGVSLKRAKKTGLLTRYS
jgi:ABC-2 type transport system permease protein